MGHQLLDLITKTAYVADTLKSDLEITPNTRFDILIPKSNYSTNIDCTSNLIAPLL